MKFIFIFFALCFSCSIFAADFCKKQDIVDQEFPAGLVGNYELIGKSPITQKTYAGTLSISTGKNNYQLTRKIGGKKEMGEAWVEFCGADKIMQLAMRYKTKPHAQELLCALGNDGNNYFRLTCFSQFAGSKSKKYGLEALFQKHD